MSKLKMCRLHLWSKKAIFLIIIALLFISGCTPVSPEPPPPPPPEPENQVPTIHYMTGPGEVTPLSNSQISCVATDADDDTLAHSWSTPSGTIAGEGENVTWTAPETGGKYVIVVTVNDGKGGEATDSVTINVTPKPNQLPIITMLVTLRDEPPITITEEMEQITVRRYSTVKIECIAEDPDSDDELTFTWEATDGRVVGEGANVEYFTSATGDHAVTVTVIDSRDGQVKSSAYFHVPCCGAG